MPTRWTLLNSYSNEMKMKKYFVNLLLKLGKWSQPKKKLSRIDTVKTHLTSGCVEGCSDQWLQCVKEVLLLNGFDTFQFVNSIKDL